jgi:PAS domain S-box-containing protein
MAQRGAGDEARLVASALQAFEEAGADFEPVLDLVCSLGSQLTGDAWIIRLVDEDDGRLRLAGSAAPHVDTTTDIRATLGPLAPSYAPDMIEPVWGPGVPTLITPDVIERGWDSGEPELIGLIERRGFAGGVVAPMRVRGRIVGLLWWACTAHEGDHDDDDLHFASSVADRCALAIDNARLLRHIATESNRHAALLAQVSDAVCVVDADGTVRHVTPGGITRILGWQPDELLGINVFDLVHRGDHDTAMSGFLRALGPDDWEPMVLRIRHKDGAWRYLEVSAQNLIDDPAVGGAVITGRDVTQRVFADGLLTEENEILERVATGRSRRSGSSTTRAGCSCRPRARTPARCRRSTTT